VKKQFVPVFDRYCQGYKENSIIFRESKKAPLRIAILGTRGIPANYGGFETFAEALSKSLVERGHEVTVYGRSHYVDRSIRSYRGVRVIVVPSVPHKYLDTPSSTLLATLDAVFRRFDLILYCNSANSFCSFLPRAAGKRVLLNVDGLEWKRAKWNRFGQAVYRISEFLSTFLPDHIVTDAREVQRYYSSQFHCASTYIPYGAPIGRVRTQGALRTFGLKKNQYILYVSRLEPENNAHIVIEAFEKVKTDMPLLIVGDAPYSHDYIRRLKRTKDSRIRFTGYVFGQGYRELQSHAYCYVQATEVGGTHPALVEAMGHGNCILANDVPEHREVLGDAGLYFRTACCDTLTERFQNVVDNPRKVEEFKKRSKARAEARYTWDKVTDAYERLFYRMMGRQS